MFAELETVDGKRNLNSRREERLRGKESCELFLRRGRRFLMYEADQRRTFHHRST